MFAKFHGGEGCDRMDMVRSRYHNGIDLVLMLVQHFPVIRVTRNLAVLIEMTLCATCIDITHGNQGSTAGNRVVEVTTSLAATADLGKAKRFSLVVVSIDEFGGSKRGRSGSGGP